MVAIRFGELLEGDFIEHDDRYEINYYTKIDKSVKLEPFVVIDKDVEIGKNTIIGTGVHLRSGTKIGENCKIGGHTIIEGKGVVVGNNIRIGPGSCLPFNTTVGNDSFIGNVFNPANDRYIDWPPTKEFEPEKLTIEENVKIGLSVTCLPGLTFGKGCFVGIGSVVTHDVKPNEIVFGNPAKSRGFID